MPDALVDVGADSQDALGGRRCREAISGVAIDRRGGVEVVGGHGIACLADFVLVVEDVVGEGVDLLLGPPLEAGEGLGHLSGTPAATPPHESTDHAGDAEHDGHEDPSRTTAGGGIRELGDERRHDVVGRGAIERGLERPIELVGRPDVVVR